MGERRRRGAVALVVAGLVLLVPVAIAYACIPLSTLNVSPTQVRPGQEVTLTGAVGVGVTSESASPVLIHLDAVDGPVLATIQPDGNGRVGATFTMPSTVSPGHHVLVATQQGPDASGAAMARAVVRVVTGDVSPLVAPAVAAERPVAPLRSSPGGAGVLVLAVLGVVGLGLFAAGAVSLACGRRPSRRAVPVRVTR